MADLERIERLIDGAPYMTRLQANRLAALFAQMAESGMPARNIVEVGTYHGAGTCYLAELTRDYGGRVATIDLPWTLGDSDHQPKVEELIERCQLDNVTVVRRASGAEGWFHDYYAGGNAYPLDVVYIDGGHTWGEVVAQFAMAYAALRSGGWLIFDDIANARYPEVGLAWDRIIKRSVSHWREAGNWGFAMKG